MKKNHYILLILFSFLVFSGFTNPSMSFESNEPTESPSYIEDFMKRAFSNIEKFYIRDASGKNETNKQISIIRQLSSEKQFEKMFEYLDTYGLQMSIEEYNLPDAHAMLSSNVSQNYRKEFPVYKLDTSGRKYGEWGVILNGTIFYNMNTGVIRGATQPTYTFLGMSGGGYPYVYTNVIASYNISSSYVTFYISYRMKQISDEPDSFIIEWDYGNFYHSFRAYPN